MLDMPNENSELPTPYIKFFAQFPEIETLEVSQWKTVHLIAHIVKYDEEMYLSNRK